jgi:hypothetical protein
MLAKQCWRLLEKSGSLCSRVFREKYYPDGNLLRTKLKPGSSFTWQSVMAGLKTFKRGCIWRRALIAQHLRCNKLTIQSNNSEVGEAMKVALQQFLLQQSYMIVIFWLQGFTKVTFEHCHREENVVAQVR